MVAETEPNDSIATAQPLNLGFDGGEVTFLTVDGTLSGIPASREITASENNGSIPLANETGISAGSTDSVIVPTLILSDTAPGGNGEDTDFFRVSSEAGQTLIVSANEVPLPLPGGGTLGTDPSIAIWDAAGNLLAFNDDVSFPSNTNSFLEFVVPADGDYFISVQHWDVNITDPFDSSSGEAQAGGTDLGVVELTISQISPDVDFYSIDLEAGDIVGSSVDGSGQTISLFDPTGQLIGQTSDNASFLYPDNSPLPGDPGDNATGSFVAPTSGTYTVAVTGTSAGSYDLDLSVHRPELEQQAEGNVQYIYLDFDGATVDPGIFGGTPGSVTLSSLSTFLSNWGLDAGDEDAVIDAIIANVQQVLVDDIATLGNNGDFSTTGTDGEFDIVILNSRDHPGFTSDNTSNLSTVYISGTISELGISTLGIAEFIDVGNFDTSDEAVVLLDLLSEAASNPNSINSLTLDPSITIIDAIGLVVGSIAAHEAGHILGNFHTDSTNAVFNVADSGGSFLYPTGPDGILGSADDPEYRFGEDELDPFEGGSGVVDTLNTIAFGASTGILDVGFLFDVLADQLTYTGDASNDVLDIVSSAGIFQGSANSAASTVRAPNSVGNVVFNLGNGANIVNVNASVNTSLSINSGIGNDDVDGGSGDDTIETGAGNDTVNAGAGNDTIVGGDGAGNDFYDGGDDIDTLVYTSTTLGISVHLANGFATGTEIDVDTITNIENVITGSGQDAITGNDVANVLSGGDERDTIFGRGGNDTINGEEGNDALFGQDGQDTLNGGTGNDVLFGGDDADILNGGDDNDVLRGEDGDDTLNGDAGDDTILGDQGSDSLNGGDDVDTANYVLSPSAVTVSLLTGTGSGGFAEGDTLTGIERLRGSFHDDFLTGDNEDNLIQGLPGGDTISGAGGNDLVFGGPGDDTINGDAGVDALFGQAGADIINGGDERDVIFGGDEGDTLNGDDGNDVLLGEAGDDTLNGGEGHDSLLGGNGADDLDGGNGFDLANYVLSSLGVNVSLATGTGSGGDAEGDTLTSIENLRGSNHADTLTGDDGSNQIRGLAGNDIIQGNGGVDVLFGNDGEDTLNGGSGTDFLNGGNDDDLYIIEDGTGIDHLIGFEAGQGSDDVADISDFSFADFNAILTAAFDVGSDVHIQLDADDVLIIQGVLEAELHQDDFLI